MKTPIDADLGDLENKLRDHIRNSREQVIKKRKISNEKSWRHATEAVESDLRNKLTSLINKFEDLYEEIEKWPSETEDE